MRYVRHGRPGSSAERDALLPEYLLTQSTGWAKWHAAHGGGDRPLSASGAVANRASARVLVKLGFVRSGQEIVVGELYGIFQMPAAST